MPKLAIWFIQSIYLQALRAWGVFYYTKQGLYGEKMLKTSDLLG
jgi:hypothetical protein